MGKFTPKPIHVQRRRSFFLIDERPSLTKTSEQESANINVIVQRIHDGANTPQGTNPPFFGDTTFIEDYERVARIINDTQEKFDRLPSHIREKFGNSVPHLLDFLDNPNNHQEALELGLITDDHDATIWPDPNAPIEDIPAPQGPPGPGPGSPGGPGGPGGPAPGAGELIG